MDACVFCEIVERERDAHVVHETPTTVAFLDRYRQPTDPGHVLVVPRAHIENIYAIDDVLGADIFAAHARLARAIKHTFAPDGITTWSSNEPGADQEVPHFHMHVYPRRIGVPFPPTRQRPDLAVPDEILAPSAERIRRALKELET
jgi:histidine triad (HIT) family protein